MSSNQPEHCGLDASGRMWDWHLPDGFRYGSDTNPQWLTVEQMRDGIAPFEKRCEHMI
jgi:hypothetical protein